MIIDSTQVIIALLGILGTVITGFIIPAILTYIKEKNIVISGETLDLLRKIVKDAVEFAEEEFWKNPEKRRREKRLLLLQN